MPKVAIVYYSSTGTNQAMANAIAEGAKSAGAEVRVRLVAETAPDAVIDSNPKWRAFVDQNKNEPKASNDDLDWADAIVFGTPTRYGNVSAQLKTFMDGTVGLWAQGKLADKVYSGFTSAANPHGGQEATLLSLFTTFYHWGGIVVTTGYTDKSVYAAGGNPYGPSVSVGMDVKPPTPANLEVAAHLGKRVAGVAAKLRG